LGSRTQRNINLCLDFSKNFVREEIFYGILLGLDLQVYDIGVIDEGDYCVKFHLCNKVNGLKWALVVFYSPAQDEHKDSFLAELVNMYSHENLPLVMGGDYNILRHPSEKNNDHYHAR
jgi:hypothetical protein